MAFCLLVVIFAVMTAAATGLLNWVRGRLLFHLGALTYPVYLLHQAPGHALIRNVQVDTWLLVTLLVAGTLTLAWLVHVLIERPVSRSLRQGLRRSLDQARVARPTASPR